MYRKSNVLNVFSPENLLNVFNNYFDEHTYKTNKPSIYTGLFRINFNTKNVTAQPVLMTISHDRVDRKLKSHQTTWTSRVPVRVCARSRSISRWEKRWLLLLVDGLLTVWVSCWMLYSLHSCLLQYSAMNPRRAARRGCTHTTLLFVYSLLLCHWRVRLSDDESLNRKWDVTAAATVKLCLV